MNSILSELRRRNVFRVAAAYLVVGWIVMQVVATIGGAAGLPGWADSFALIILVAGFPVVLFIAWAFELTPEGIKKTETGDEPVGFRPLGPSDYLLIAGVIVVLGVGAAQIFTQPSTEPVVIAAEPAAEIPAAANTIAVLPFADLSEAGDQEYFADGISEEILNVLVRIDGLDVTSRTSSFQFKGRDLGIPYIADELGVRHVLEGSLRRAGNTVRITAQLIDTQTDVHLWSETYDRPLTAENLFAIQDEIATAIVAALGVELGLTEMLEVEVLTENLTAYDLYLEARPLFIGRYAMDRAEELLARAVELDPDFARAWELRAGTIYLLDDYGYRQLSDQESHTLALEYANRALELEPDSSLAYAVIGAVRSESGRGQRRHSDWADILAQFDRALEIDPHNTSALLWRGIARLSVGDLEMAATDIAACVDLEPYYLPCRTNYSFMIPEREGDAAALDFHMQSLKLGVSLWGIIDLPLLARAGDELLFYSSSSSPQVLAGWPRHEELYAAYQNLDGNYEELAQDILEFAAGQSERNKDIISMITIPLGAHHVEPIPISLWRADHTRYRQSPEFRAFIRETGILSYWRIHGFPPQCRAIGEDDFQCD
jgi:TolB-like protein